MKKQIEPGAQERQVQRDDLETMRADDFRARKDKVGFLGKVMAGVAAISASIGLGSAQADQFYVKTGDPAKPVDVVQGELAGTVDHEGGGQSTLIRTDSGKLRMYPSEDVLHREVEPETRVGARYETASPGTYTAPPNGAMMTADHDWTGRFEQGTRIESTRRARIVVRQGDTLENISEEERTFAVVAGSTITRKAGGQEVTSELSRPTLYPGDKVEVGADYPVELGEGVRITTSTPETTADPATTPPATTPPGATAPPATTPPGATPPAPGTAGGGVKPFPGAGVAGPGTGAGGAGVKPFPGSGVAGPGVGATPPGATPASPETTTPDTATPETTTEAERQKYVIPKQWRVYPEPGETSKLPEGVQINVLSESEASERSEASTIVGRWSYKRDDGSVHTLIVTPESLARRQGRLDWGPVGEGVAYFTKIKPDGTGITGRWANENALGTPEAKGREGEFQGPMEITINPDGTGNIKLKTDVNPRGFGPGYDMKRE